ncbi:MAG TPA: hypothetical protein VM618_04045, partial [Acidimicrobiia bacterium]|nr:hypothetical protein [Acidimicrobiia bacterium]
RVVDTAALAWSYDGHRRLPWRRERRVAVGERGLTVLARHLDGGPGDRRESWLAQETAAERPFVEGVTLEQQFLDAASRHDLDAVADVLVRWRRHLRGLLAPAPATGAGDTPFSPGAGAAALPPECLDVDLSNFVVDTDGETLVQVDTEWRVAGGVDDELVTARALRYLAERVVVTGAPLPWDPATTVDDLTRHLASMCGVTVTDDLHERWLSAEAELQALVRGASVEGLRGELARIGGATQNDVAVPATRRASTPPPPASTTPLPAPSLGRRLARRLGVGG